MILKIALCSFCIIVAEGEIAVDGVWNDWSDWGGCSVTCGHGNQTRSRTCEGPYFGGANCTGAYDETRECMPLVCPIDGVWNDWSDWGGCSVTCGHGNRTRSRTCEGPFFSGANCTGAYDETRECMPLVCPIDGVWNDWSGWSGCSVTCGQGNRTRNRTCEGPYFGGANCAGEYDETRECVPFECPNINVKIDSVDGVWNDWSGWGGCSVTYGHGNQTRSRTCVGPLFGGANCAGAYDETRECMSYSCQNEANHIEQDNFSDSNAEWNETD